MADVSAGPSQKTLLYLKVADTLWSWLVVGSLCIIYWTGTWKLLDYLILPGSYVNSGWVSLAVGAPFGIAGYIILPILGGCIKARCSLTHVIASRLFLYIYCFIMMHYWRGVWQVSDGYLGYNWRTSCICLAVCFAILIPLRGLANCTSSPFSVELDTRPNFYNAYPRFRTQVIVLCNFNTYLYSFSW